MFKLFWLVKSATLSTSFNIIPLYYSLVGSNGWPFKWDLPWKLPVPVFYFSSFWNKICRWDVPSLSKQVVTFLVCNGYRKKTGRENGPIRKSCRWSVAQFMQRIAISVKKMAWSYLLQIFAKTTSRDGRKKACRVPFQDAETKARVNTVYQRKIIYKKSGFFLLHGVCVCGGGVPWRVPNL